MASGHWAQAGDHIIFIKNIYQLVFPPAYAETCNLYQYLNLVTYVCVSFFCLFVCLYIQMKKNSTDLKKIVFAYKGMDHESDMGYNIRSLNHNAELQETRLTVKNGVFWTSIAVFGEVIL